MQYQIIADHTHGQYNASKLCSTTYEYYTLDQDLQFLLPLIYLSRQIIISLIFF